MPITLRRNLNFGPQEFMMSISVISRTNLCRYSVVFIAGILFNDVYALEEEIKTRISLGAGMANTPEYEGSSHNKFSVIPVIKIVHGRWSFGGIGGVSLNLSDRQNIQFGPQLGYSFGRDENESPHLSGLGDIDGGMNAGFFFSATINQLKLGMTFSKGLSGNVDGTRLDLSGAYTFKLSQQHHLSTGVTSSWMNDQYASEYFGVSALQATNSGLTAYNAQSGIKDAGVNLTWMYIVDKNWISITSLSTKQLLNDAKHSPVVTDQKQNMIFYSLIYNF